MDVGTFFAERLCEFARCAVVTRNALSLSKEITFKGTHADASCTDKIY